MKIIILHFGKKGAGPVYSLEMAKALSKFGHDIIFYASSNIENKEIILKEKFNKRFFQTYNSKLGYLKSILFRDKINNIIKQIKLDKPDIVYSPMNDLWIPFIFPKLKNIQRIKTIHDVGVHEGNNSLFNKWWNKSNFKDAEKFIILSNKFKQDVIKKGIKESNICVIPHAGFKYYENFKNNNDNIIEECDLLFFGRIDKYKGLNFFLDAVEILISKFPNIKVSIVGSGDLSPYMDKILKFKNNIYILNRWIKDEEINQIIPYTKIVVLPYTHATQSGVIPLAYTFGKPVIATNTGGLEEQIVNNETGLLIKKNSLEDLVFSIQYLLNNPSKIVEMGKKAKIFLEDNLTWESSATKLINFISNNN